MRRSSDWGCPCRAWDHRVVRQPDEYRSPLRRYIWVTLFFLLIVVTGVVTVLIPEIQDDPGDSVEAIATPNAEVAPAE